MDSSFYSTYRRTSSHIRSTEFKSVGSPPFSHRLSLGKSRMVPYHALSTWAISLPPVPASPSPTTAAPSSDPRPTPSTSIRTSVLHAVTTSLPVSSTPVLPIPRAPAASHLQIPPLPFVLYFLFGRRPAPRAGRRYPPFTLRKPWPQNDIIKRAPHGEPSSCTG